MRWRDNEGLLLQLDEGWNGSQARKSTTYRYRSPYAGPYPPEFGNSHNFGGDGVFHKLHRPKDRVQVQQQGVTFTWEATAYDTLARPTRVVRSGPSGTQTEQTAYHDNTSAWVLGQVASVTHVNTGQVPERHDYHPTTAARTASYKFGWRTGRWSYHPDGTIHEAFDAADRATRFTNYARGLARNISYPDGTSESVTVNNLGLVAVHTNAAGFDTGYGYDTMGRLSG